MVTLTISGDREVHEGVERVHDRRKRQKRPGPAAQGHDGVLLPGVDVIKLFPSSLVTKPYKQERLSMSRKSFLPSLIFAGKVRSRF
jgi:hypothetical protein